MKLKIAAVTVLYNPDHDVLENISSYIEGVDKLYAVDNSEKKNKTTVEALRRDPKIDYIDNHGNQGIAHALNVGAKEAIRDQNDYLLIMDQDSRFLPGDIHKFIANIDSDSKKIGIIAPFSYENESTLYPFYDLISITSGSVYNLDVYSEVGPFKNEFFIDEVDVEYCLRMNKSGYYLKRINSIVLTHKLGDSKEARFLFWKFYTSNHSAIRRYYIIRNRLYIWKNFRQYYPEYVKFEQMITVKEIIKILFAENNKLAKLKMTLRGYLDYRKGIFGKYKDV